MAFFGVRGCELAALRIQDRVLMEGPVADPDYAARRRAALVIAVECTVAGATCFCTSMGTGPEVTGDDADIILTELEDGFLVRTPTVAGGAIAARLPLGPASEDMVDQGRAAVAAVREAIGDPVAVEGLPGLTSVTTRLNPKARRRAVNCSLPISLYASGRVTAIHSSRSVVP